MKLIRISGKARGVLHILRLLAEKRGQVTLGELAKESKP